MIFLIFYIIGISTTLNNIFTQRSINVYESFDIYLSVVSDNQAVVIIGRITTALFLLICISGIIVGLIRRNFQLPKQGFLLTIAGLLLFLPVVISSIFSKNGGFSYKLLFFPLLVITAYIGPRYKLERIYELISPVLIIIIYSSLLSILIDPAWAFSSYSQSWIGIPIRLYGTANHPNSLGYIALAYLILERLTNKRSFWFYLNLFAAIITIILAQSKSVWVSIFVWIILEWFIKNIIPKKQKATRSLIALLIVFLFAATFFFIFQKEFLNNYNFTLTGRINVWLITFETWLANPLFGYGPKIWDISFRQTYGYLWAGQSHNQFLQTLGESGIIGLGCLLYYYSVIIKFGSRYANMTNFSTFAIIIAIIIRSFFEAPFCNYNLDSGFLVHAIFFIIILNSEFVFNTIQKTTVLDMIKN